MSRTIRRTRGDRSRRPEVSELLIYDHQRYRWWDGKDLYPGEEFYYTEKEWVKRITKYFSDAGWRGYRSSDTRKVTRHIYQVSYRQKAEQQLIRFCKNQDHEVIIPRKNLLPWS